MPNGNRIPFLIYLSFLATGLVCYPDFNKSQNPALPLWHRGIFEANVRKFVLE